MSQKLSATQPRLTNELQSSEKSCRKNKVWNMEDTWRWPLLSPQHTVVQISQRDSMRRDNATSVLLLTMYVPNLTETGSSHSLYEASLPSKQSRKPEEGITRELKASTQVSQMWLEWCLTQWQQNPVAHGSMMCSETVRFIQEMQICQYMKINWCH